MKTRLLVVATALLLVACNVGQSQTFNEIRISSPGSEDDVSNFFELFGIPGTSFDGFSVLSISSEFAPGEVSFAFDLSGTAIPTDGFYLASTDATEYGAQTDFVTGADFFGSPQSFLLVDGFSGLQGDDLDTNDDGVFDLTPWTSIIDAVSLADGNSVFSYGGPVAGPDGNFTPGHVFRDIDGAGTFQIGVFGDRSNDTAGASNVAVPEPASAIGLGILAVAGLVKRRRQV